ncbi:MAG: hypothetical protein WCA08_26005 [Desulfoferrobacter sp.]
MPRSPKNNLENPLKSAKFPMIFERGEAKAVILNMQKFRELELFVDNLINLRAEQEDALIKDSGLLEKMIERAREESAKSSGIVDWVAEIDGL